MFFYQVSKLLRGDYDDVIGSYQIIDCRYPYEYEGGHVKVCTALYNVSLIFEVTLLATVNEVKYMWYFKNEKFFLIKT